MPMTPEEYNVQEKEVLEGVHPALANVLRMQAYDRGHSCGHDEVLGILQGLVYEFRKVNELLVRT